MNIPSVTAWTQWNLDNIPVPSSLEKKDLEDIVIGACFFASGGGGPIAVAQNFLKDPVFKDNKVKLIHTKNLGDDPHKAAFVICDMGSPDALMQNPDLGNTAPVNASIALKEYLEKEVEGIELKVCYLLPIELGAVNTLLPFFVAAKIDPDIQVIDGDPAGRAVPTIGLTTLHTNANNAIGICPAVVAPADNPKVKRSPMTYLDSRIDPDTLEYAAGLLVKHWGKIGGLACYPTDESLLTTSGRSGRNDAENPQRLIQGSIGLCWDIGRRIHNGVRLSELLATLKDPKGYGIKNNVLIENATAIPVAGGQAASILDVGKYIMRDDEGKEIWIYFQNENLLAYDPEAYQKHKKVEEGILAMGPDIITFLTYPEGKPVSNPDVQPCQRYTVIGMAADRRVRNTPMIINFQKAINEILLQIDPGGDYDLVPYIPIELTDHWKWGSREF